MRSTDQLAMTSSLFIVCKIIIFSVLSEGTFEKAPLFLGPAKIAFASDVRLHYFIDTWAFVPEARILLFFGYPLWV